MDTQSPDAAPVLADLIAAGPRQPRDDRRSRPARPRGRGAARALRPGRRAGLAHRPVPLRLPRRRRAISAAGSRGSRPADWTAALEAALQAALGADAVWLNATDLLPGAGAALDQPLLLLRAHGAAVAAGLEAAAPGLQAVINARFAADCARLAAGAEPGGALDARLARHRGAPGRDPRGARGARPATGDGARAG